MFHGVEIGCVSDPSRNTALHAASLQAVQWLNRHPLEVKTLCTCPPHQKAPKNKRKKKPKPPSTLISCQPSSIVSEEDAEEGSTESSDEEMLASQALIDSDGEDEEMLTPSGTVSASRLTPMEVDGTEDVYSDDDDELMVATAP